MECNLGNTVASPPQSWDWLENRKSEDDKISRGMWEAVKTKARKVRVAETEGWREERRRRKETGEEREREEKRKKKTKENGSMESSRRLGNMRWRGESGKIRRRDKEVESSKIP